MMANMIVLILEGSEISSFKTWTNKELEFSMRRQNCFSKTKQPYFVNARKSIHLSSLCSHSLSHNNQCIPIPFPFEFHYN